MFILLNLSFKRSAGSSATNEMKQLIFLGVVLIKKKQIVSCDSLVTMTLTERGGGGLKGESLRYHHQRREARVEFLPLHYDSVPAA